MVMAFEPNNTLKFYIICIDRAHWTYLLGSAPCASIENIIKAMGSNNSHTTSFWDFHYDVHPSFAAMGTTADIDSRQSHHDLLHAVIQSLDTLSRRIEKNENQNDIFAFVPVKQKTKISDFNKPGRQHMQQKSPDEFLGRQDHFFGAPISKPDRNRNQIYPEVERLTLPIGNAW